MRSIEPLFEHIKGLKNHHHMVQCAISYGPIRVKNMEKKIRHKKNLPQIMYGAVPTFTGMSRVCHVKIQSHVVNLRTIFSYLIWPTESDGTFEISNFGQYWSYVSIWPEWWDSSWMFSKISKKGSKFSWIAIMIRFWHCQGLLFNP